MPLKVMTNRTETDPKLMRVATCTPVLVQVWPMSVGYALPRWAVDREISIGRDVDQEREICLSEDRRASKRHALVRPVADGVEIVDQDSKNHTYVDGQQIRDARLNDGAVVRVGSTLFVLREEKPSLVDAPKTERPIHDRLRGQSQEVRALRYSLSQAARSMEPVLLIGSTGTGKELAAASIHALSARGNRPFVAVNCASLESNLAESKLFGHKRGAFTGADRDQDGLFKAADSGTLFLDELGELPIDTQAKLLRALQPAAPGQKQEVGRNRLAIRPSGSTIDVGVDVRVIAATNVELEEAVRYGRFREDLLKRLSVIVIRMPTLASRRDDILLLLDHYLNLDSPAGKRRVIDAPLGELLLLQKWDGNVRALENWAKRMCAWTPIGELLSLDTLTDDELAKLRSVTLAAAMPSAAPLSKAPEEPITRDLLTRLLHKTGGLIAPVARILGRSPRQIRRRMEEFGIPRPSLESRPPATNSRSADTTYVADEAGGNARRQREEGSEDP